MNYNINTIMEELVIHLVQINKYNRICNKEYMNLVNYRCLDTTSSLYTQNNCEKMVNIYNSCMCFKIDKLKNSSNNDKK